MRLLTTGLLWAMCEALLHAKERLARREAAMLNETELTTAVDLHRRAYQLLLWVDQAIREGKIRLDRIHEDMSAASAAQ